MDVPANVLVHVHVLVLVLALVLVVVRVHVPVLALALILATPACSETPTAPAPAPAPAPASAPAASPAAAAPLGVELRAEPSGAGFAPVLVQRGTAPASLDGALALERRRGDRWESVANVELALRPDCASPIPACLQLVPGAELHPPPWPARIGASQCGCPACGPAPAGDYRFVARGCNGGARVESPAFQLR